MWGVWLSDVMFLWLTAPQHAVMNLNRAQPVTRDSELSLDLKRGHVPYDHTAVCAARVRHRLTATRVQGIQHSCTEPRWEFQMIDVMWVTWICRLSPPERIRWRPHDVPSDVYYRTCCGGLWCKWVNPVSRSTAAVSSPPAYSSENKSVCSYDSQQGATLQQQHHQLIYEIVYFLLL